ncbi:MAG: hypothetical protein ACI8T1_004122 [Verrucomicrobiales bacterium]
MPKENINIGVRIPKEKKGQMMTGTWFAPYSGTFSEPFEKEITQWPSFEKPEKEGFTILIVNTQPIQR